MAVSRAEKVTEQGELEAVFRAAETAVLVDYRGVTVPQVTELRRQIRAAGASYRVVKNTLARRAATGTALEYCSIPDPGTIAAGTWWILAQNWGGSASQPDDILLAVGVVPDASSGNMTISGPTSVAAKDLFSININWNVGAISRYDRWYGAFDLGTDPGNSGNLGRVDVDLVQFQADIFLPIVIRSP